MTVTVTPFKDAGCGADISGVDLRQPLTPKTATRSAPPGSTIWCCASATSR